MKKDFKLHIDTSRVPEIQVNLLVKILATQQALVLTLIERMSLSKESEDEALNRFYQDVLVKAGEVTKLLNEEFAPKPGK